MAEFFKITYERKQVTTDFLNDRPLKEVTTYITETIGGLPATTVANYRKVLGDQFKTCEPDESFSTHLRDSHKVRVETKSRKIGRTAVMGPAAEDDAALTGSYATLINKMAARENAA